MVRCLVFIAVLAAGFYPQNVQAGGVDFFFPMLKDESNDPGNTLEAPFTVKTEKELAAEAAKAEGVAKAETEGAAPVAEEVLTKAVNPQNSIDMDKPHRASSVISEWIVTAVSEIMTFDDGKVGRTYKDTASHFEKRGREQYVAFLKEVKIDNVLKSGKYKIRSYVNDAPLLLNEGPVSGRYRWLYEVPLMLSYLKLDVADYKDAEPVNQQVVLRVQVGRSPDAQNDMGISIERLSGEAKVAE